jgi:hypothetical protein
MSFIRQDSEAAIVREEGVIEKTTTLAYRAPELIDLRTLTLLPREQRCLGPAVDVWALGCALFKLAFGRTPFEDASGTPQRMAIMAGAERLVIPRTSPYSPQLHGLIRACLQAAPADRPTAAQLLAKGAAECQHWPRDQPAAVGPAVAPLSLPSAPSGSQVDHRDRSTSQPAFSAGSDASRNENSRSGGALSSRSSRNAGSLLSNTSGLAHASGGIVSETLVAPTSGTGAASRWGATLASFGAHDAQGSTAAPARGGRQQRASAEATLLRGGGSGVGSPDSPGRGLGGLGGSSSSLMSRPLGVSARTMEVDDRPLAARSTAPYLMHPAPLLLCRLPEVVAGAGAQAEVQRQ